MKLVYWFVLGLLTWAALFTTWTTWAQTPPTSCEEQLNNEMFQNGALKQQLAVAREQLRVATEKATAEKVKATEKK